MRDTVSNAIFDPWTATVEQAIWWADRYSQSAPSPLAQRQAATEVMASHAACLAADGGCLVLRCLSLCGANQLTPPGWLWDAFNYRMAKVTEAEVPTLDKAFGRYWPAHTRLSAVRSNKKLKTKIHTAAWGLEKQEPGIPVNRDFFQRISEMPGIFVGASTVERLYYEAVKDGLPSIALLRKSALINPKEST